MPKRNSTTLAALIAASLSGCGESYPEDARRYHAAAQEVLVTKQMCAAPQDCQRKEVLFWEGGNPWLPGHHYAYVTLYGTSDTALVEAIVARLKQAKTETSMPPVKLVVYSSKHRQSKVTFREVTIE
jgi:hypothetical protein